MLRLNLLIAEAMERPYKIPTKTVISNYFQHFSSLGL